MDFRSRIFRHMMTTRGAVFVTPSAVSHCLLLCRSASDALACGMYQITNDRECCSPMVREKFIRHAERHMQVRPPSDSSPSPPPSQQLQPPAELVGCVTQRRRGDHERDEASDAGELSLFFYAEYFAFTVCE